MFENWKLTAPLNSSSSGPGIPVAVTRSFTIWSYGLLRANASRKYFCMPARLIIELLLLPPVRPISKLVQIVVQFRAYSS